MTNPDREELFTPDELAVRLDEWANCLDRSQWDLRSDMRCAAIHLRRLASSDSGVKVRELDWHRHPDGETQRYEGVAAIGNNYAVFKAWWGLHHKWGWVGGDSGFFHTEEEAKAACQADYEARIRSALVEVPAVKGEPEPVAWRDDPTSDERWNAGCDFAMTQLCRALDVDPDTVNWDAATETVDGDVQSVIWNILRARMGEDWDPDTAPPADAGMREACMRILPYLRWTISDESPGHHPTMPSAVAEFEAALTAPGATTKSDGAASNDIDTCIACAVPLVDGDMVYSDASGGCIHAACCGPERESYVGNDGEPLKDGDPIPEPWPWTVDPSSTRSDVTADELAREIEANITFDIDGKQAWANGEQAARALLETHEIRRK